MKSGRIKSGRSKSAKQTEYQYRKKTVPERLLLSLALCIALVAGLIPAIAMAQGGNIQTEGGAVEGQAVPVTIDMKGAPELRLALPGGVTLLDGGGATTAADGSLILTGGGSVSLGLSASAGNYSLQLKNPDGTDVGSPVVLNVEAEVEAAPAEEPVAEPATPEEGEGPVGDESAVEPVAPEEGEEPAANEDPSGNENPSGAVPGESTESGQPSEETPTDPATEPGEQPADQEDQEEQRPASGTRKLQAKKPRVIKTKDMPTPAGTETQLTYAIATATGASLQITLTNDITLTGKALEIPAGKEITLLGADKKLIGATDFDVITVAGVLTLDGPTITHEGRTGRGISVDAGGRLTMVGGSITKNSVIGGDGGGVYAPVGGFTMSGGSITENTATGDGGGVYGGGMIQSGEISNNRAGRDGGGVHGYAMMYGGTVSGNVATRHGGGFYVDKGYCYLNSMFGAATVSDNIATTGNGGGVYLTGPTTLSFDMSGTLDHNTAGGNGGGVYFSTHDQVKANISSGARIIRNEAHNGGGAYFETGMGSTFNLGHGSELSDNKASNNGGGAYVSGDYISANGSKVMRNSAGVDGGAFWVGENEYGSAYSAVFGNGTEVSGNVAGNDGGGVWVAHKNLGSVGVFGSIFSDNTARCGTDKRNAEDDAVYTTGIYNDTWSVPFTQGYNNFDIAYPALPAAIIFDANGGTGTMADQPASPGKDLTLTANAFTREDHTFTGWNTRADGTGTKYADRHAFTPWKEPGDLTLYAQWRENEKPPAPVTVTITYNANGGTGTMADQPATVGEDLTLAANAFTRRGHTFTGWNTRADGAGTSYSNRQAFTPWNRSSDLILYAQWRRNTTVPVTYTVTYLPGTHGTFTAQTTRGLLAGMPTPAAPTIVGEDGWSFTGWNPVPGATVTGNATYTAQWREVPAPPADLFTVTFVDWNGTVLKVEQVPGGGDATAPGNPVRGGYTFSGWDIPFTNVTSDLTVTALYVVNPTGGTVVEEPPAGNPDPEDDPTPTLRNPTSTTTIDDSEVPLAAESLTRVWALVNLILAAIGVLLAVVTGVRAITRRRREEEHGGNEYNREEDEKSGRLNRPVWLTLTLVAGIAGIVLFFLTEDMRLPMVLVDEWTIWNAAILVVEIVGAVFSFKGKDENDEVQRSRAGQTQAA